MYELIVIQPFIYVIPITIFAFFAGIVCGIKLTNLVIRHRLEGMANVKKMESE